MDFWGLYSYPYVSFIPTDFKDKVWSPDNPDAYFPRPMAYAATSGTIGGWDDDRGIETRVNDRYLQNLRYLRFKNLTVGYTFPAKWTKKAYIQKLRIYFTAENLCYWSPLKKNTKYIDPEGAIERKSKNSSGKYEADANEKFYPWSKSFMFGIDVTF